MAVILRISFKPGLCSEQCSAVWPEARCEKSRCECPEDVNGIPYLMAKTRDCVVCVLHSGEDGDPVGSYFVNV